MEIIFTRNYVIYEDACTVKNRKKKILQFVLRTEISMFFFFFLEKSNKIILVR